VLDLSVVIPAFNEAERLPSTLSSVHEFLSESGKSFEIIVVDDGSTDRTAAVVDEFSARLSSPERELRRLNLATNSGKGHAVRFGVLNARGRRILLSDADCSSPIGELRRLEEALDNGADVAIGSRGITSAETRVDSLPSRRFAGTIFNTAVRILLLPGIRDTQCGFKLYRRDVALRIFCGSRLNRYGFDVETLFIARALGYDVAEVPINWRHVAGSKVNMLTYLPTALYELLFIKLRAVAGRYEDHGSVISLGRRFARTRRLPRVDATFVHRQNPPLSERSAATTVLRNEPAAALAQPPQS
jgi:dolichyl-phosphate beta-glucosyltransferase